MNLRVICFLPLFLLMLFICGSPCNRNFMGRFALVQHQAKCSIHQRIQELAVTQRKEVILKRKRSRSEAGNKVPQKKVKVHLPEPSPASASGSPQGLSLSTLSTPANQPQDPEHVQYGPPPPVLTPSGRPQRQHRLPARFRDTIPEGPAPVEPPRPPPPPLIRRVILHVKDVICTSTNAFGLFREYPNRPSYDPDACVPLDDLSDIPRPSKIGPASSDPATAPPWPFANMTIYRLMEWMNTGSHLKSASEVTRLADEVLTSPDFCAGDLKDFNAQRQNERFDRSKVGTDKDVFAQDSWRQVDIDIIIPSGTGNPSGDGHPFTVSGFRYRRLLDVIKSAFSELTALKFHLSPFKQFVRLPDGTPMRVHGEVFTSDAYLNACDDLRKQPSEPGCRLEKVVAALMFFSDSTHLTNFGTAKAWPIYMSFGNLSKYLRAKPGSGAYHHVAFIPSLPGRIREFLAGLADHSSSHKADLLAHCRRELMHGVWRHLMDDDFIAAYKHGLVIQCADGVMRRIYPRIFIYSADYPEKVLLATIHRGLCLCPRCLTLTAKMDGLGTAFDRKSRVSMVRTYAIDSIRRARDFIYKLGRTIKSVAVKAVLSSHSWVPTINSFAEKLGPLGFDLFPALVVDLLHEFELGVWKMTFTHLIRLLNAASPGGAAVTLLNSRYRQISPFGRDTIRRFPDNASEMKRLAARNFEDLLQCAIPVFENLLPDPHNEIVMALLYRLAQWHALAKLRMHTEFTLGVLDDVTGQLGQAARKFKSITCKSFETNELASEAQRRCKRKQHKMQVPNTNHLASTLGTDRKPSKAKKKNFNLRTYKFHALGDYVNSVRMFGTTDSYSTQIGEREHRRVKRYYARTNKRQAIQQIVKLERREARLRRAKAIAKANSDHSHHVGIAESDPLPYTIGEMHHHISESRHHPLDLFSFSRRFPEDPASRNFVPKLKDHLLGRLLGMDYDGDEHPFTNADRNSIIIVDNRVFCAKVLRINYTTYDVRRDQDSMNPRTLCNVMVQSCETEKDHHPFWYARVLGVFHARVLHVGPRSQNKSVQTMEFLWVRWFGLSQEYRTAKSKTTRLPQIGFVPDSDPSAFGFLDPSLVIRGCHLVPAFAHGRTSELLRAVNTVARPVGETDDWTYFYVMIFVDRDMYMRYLGGGIGHSLSTAHQPDDIGHLVEESEADDTTNDRDAGGDDEDDNDGDDTSDDDSEEDSEEDDEDGEEIDSDLGPEDGEDCYQVSDDDGFADL